MSKLLATSCLGALVAFASATPAAAQIDARMFRYPDVSASRITFVYGGDIWVVPKAGGVAIRLSSPPGEELFPRFSPDGSKIAYSANYDGNLDVYVVASLGGEPVRLTHHPMDDRVVGWHPDGKRVLFASSRASGRQRFNQFYLVSVTGGLPERLPVPYGEFGAFSPDGQRVRLHAAVAGLPHVEAVSRRLGAGHLDLRPRDAGGAERHEQRGERRAPDVARRDDVLHVRPRRGSAPEPVGVERSDRRRAAGDRLQGLRHHVPVDWAGRDRVPGRRSALPARSRE